MPHNHNHNHTPANYNSAFIIGIILNLIFVAVEVTYGIAVNSLALISDAGHNLSDVFTLIFAWGASWLASKSPTTQRTYGFRRATILASLFSAILLFIVLGGIFWEAIGRFKHPVPINTMTVMVVAGIGIIINTITALLFISGRDRDLNIKGAFLHMVADAAVSMGVVISNLVIMLEGWLWLDPAVSILIAVIIFWGTWGLLRDSLNLSLDAVPAHIDRVEVETYLMSLSTVTNLHDLHIWAMSTTEVALTVHLIVPGECDHDFLQKIAHTLHERYGIAHSTIQIERKETPTCKQSHPGSL